MNNLLLANQARLDNAINKLYRYSQGVMTLGQWIERYAVSYEAKEEPRIEYNRRKFNNMDAREQAAYEAKLAEKVTRYYAVSAEGNLISIPKMVFDHYTA